MSTFPYCAYIFSVVIIIEYNRSQIIVILGFLEQYFQLVSENMFERYHKSKLQFRHGLLWGK